MFRFPGWFLIAFVPSSRVCFRNFHGFVLLGLQTSPVLESSDVLPADHSEDISIISGSVLILGSTVSWFCQKNFCFCVFVFYFFCVF